MDDARQIENLLYTYARRLDAGDLEGTAALFARARIIAPGGGAAMEGSEAVLAMYRQSVRLYDDGTPRTRHITSNPLIDVTGDTATCQSYFTVMQSLEGFPLQPIISGHYEDQFARDSHGWHFTERAIFSELFGDLSHHLLIDLAPA